MLTYAIGAAAAAAKRRGADGAVRARYSLYLLYWHNSTNTDAEGANGAVRARYSRYLLFWYKSTNTDAEGAASS